MKKIIFAVLILSAFQGYAQPNWKDSTIAKYKVVDAYELDGMVYFKTSKGWGVYWPVQSWVAVPPIYQFVLAKKESELGVFYAVKKNKIHVIDDKGKLLSTQTFTQIGEGFQGNEKFALENGIEIFYEGEKVVNTQAYDQLSSANENSITLKNNLVLLNIFQKPMEPQQFWVNHDGIDSDSLDENGKPVMQYFSPTCLSGIYDTKTQKWIIPIGAAKVGMCGTNILVKEIVKSGTSTEQKISVYDKTFQKTGSFSLSDALTKPEAIKIILSDYNPLKIEKCFENKQVDLIQELNFNLMGEVNQLFKFDNGTKQGLYSPSQFKVLMAPEKNDFIFVPNAFNQSIFTVQNSKVGFTDRAGTKFDYSNMYEKLSKTYFFIGYAEQWYDVMQCNNGNTEPISQKDTGQINNKFLDQMVGFKQRASLEVNGQFIIVEDFVPIQLAEENMYPISVVDANGNTHDSIRYIDELENPIYAYPERDLGGSYGGVYNTNSKSWVVPRKFSKIIKTENGFSCIRNYHDTLTHSLYSTDGKIIFTGLSADSLVKNSALLSKYIGVKFSGGLKSKILSNQYYYYDGLQVQLNDAKQSGVFDLYNLKWIVKPEYDLVDFNFTNSTFTMMKDNKMGLTDLFGNTMAEPLYNKIEYKYYDGGYILNDSLFCSAEHPFNTILIDSVKFVAAGEQYGNYDLSSKFNAEIINKRLVVGESMKKMNYVFDEVGENYNSPINICFSRIIDPQNFKQLNYSGAVTVIPWKSGAIIYDTLYNWCFVNEKNERTVISSLYNNLSYNKDFIYTTSDLKNFVFDQNGTVTKVEVEMNDWDYDPSIQTVGNFNAYFDGEKMIEIPTNFYLLALNKFKFGFGYTLTLNTDKAYAKKYTYYDFNTNKYVSCEFEFAAFNKLEVATVNGYFVFMERNLANNTSNVWLVEEDLKTIKSAFKELVSYSYQMNFNPVREFILFGIQTKLEKDIFFDKDFQFILEGTASTYEISTPKWNRLFLSSPQKTIQMNLKGQILNK